MGGQPNDGRDPEREIEHLLLLTLLRLGEPAYGVTIRREIEGRTGRRVSPGAIFTALQRLAERGLVSSWLGEPTAVRGGKCKRYYQLEAAGQESLRFTQERMRRLTDGLSVNLSLAGGGSSI